MSSQRNLDEPVKQPGTPADGWPCMGGCGRGSLYTTEGAGYRCWNCRHNDERARA